MEVAEPRARQPRTLPMDMLLEIIARSDDVTTVVRCAAGCKPLRRAMLDPDRGFLNRLRSRAEANGGFDPYLLMAVSYRATTCHIDNDGGTVIRTDSIVVEPPGCLRHFDTDLLARSSEPLSSRDGLLVVRHHGILLVCNTITGHVTSLPRTGLPGGTSASSIKTFQPALLSVDGAGRSFELLVMCEYEEWRHDQWGLRTQISLSQEDNEERRHYPRGLRTQIFSSQEDKWGATREIHIHKLPEGVLNLTEASSSAPAVMGRSVHWLCYRRGELIILAIHTESAHASVIKLPQELLTRMGLLPSLVIRDAETRILVTNTTMGREKRLSLVVAEALVISMWTLVPEAADGSSSSWSEQLVIRRREIGTQLTSVFDAYQPIRLCMFGERSGTLLFWLQSVGLLQLNLGTKKALVLWRSSDKAVPEQAFLHEMNLISVLECMNFF